MTEGPRCVHRAATTASLAALAKRYGRCQLPQSSAGGCSQHASAPCQASHAPRLAASEALCTHWHPPLLQMSLIMNESNFQHILRVLNTNLDGKVKAMFALTSIKGVGRRFSNICCKKAEVELGKR